MRLTTFLPPVLSWLVLQSALVAGHARIRYPTPFDAPPETPAGNAYNVPLKADGSDFPCKGLHKSATAVQPTEWTAGSETYFEYIPPPFPFPSPHFPFPLSSHPFPLPNSHWCMRIGANGGRVQGFWDTRSPRRAKARWPRTRAAAARRRCRSTAAPPGRCFTASLAAARAAPSSAATLSPTPTKSSPFCCLRIPRAATPSLPGSSTIPPPLYSAQELTGNEGLG